MSATDPTVGGSPRLECRGITVRYGGLLAVNDVSISVPAGELVGLVGPNGAGKSTLFGVVSGLVTPSRGTVLIDGEDVTRASPQLRAARGLARTFQHPEIFGGLTVRQHLVLAHRARTAKRRVWSDLFTLGSLRPADSEEKAMVDGLIESLGLVTIADRPATGLPLGLCRLVELGRALATSPTVLLLDEPSSGLDSAETGEFEETLRRMAGERGVSVLIVEHDVELVMRLCPQMHVLDFGLCIADGSPDEIRTNPHVRAAYLGEELSPDGGDGGDVDKPSAVVSSAITAGTGIDDGSSPMLAVEGLCVRYGQAVAVSDASFAVPSGGTLAILGPNGAGKSSLARAISGLVRPASGRVCLEGKDITAASPSAIRRSGLVHLPEGRGVFRNLSVTENLRMATAMLHGRPARNEAIELAFELFPNLATRRRQRAGSLSGGEQQMLSLARALAISPTLLIADELSLGLAPILVESVFEGLGRARDAGVTVVMIEQYVHRALQFADDCLVLQRGVVVWQGAVRSMDEDLLRHYLGESMTAVP
jgi:branched-chain amino acid transport system ATP-binding protein